MSARYTADFAMHRPGQLAYLEALEVVAQLQQHAVGVRPLGNNGALQRRLNEAQPQQWQQR